MRHDISSLTRVATFVVVALTLTACESFLDVHPKAEKLEGDLFTSAKGFEDAIYGVYGEMQTSALYGQNLIWGIAEIQAQNLHCTSETCKALASYDYTISGVQNLFSNTWTEAYKTIGYANNILDQLGKKSESDLPLYHYYKAEMLAVRAMLHFDLLRIFGPMDPEATGIPYVTVYSPTVKPFLKVSEDYDHILSDLLEAENLLADEKDWIKYPRNNDQYDKFLQHQETHLNLYAVKALLARVYWMKGDLALAAAKAIEVIDSEAFPLIDESEVKDYVAGVISPKETIFGLYSTTYASNAESILYNYTTNVSYIPYHNNTSGSSSYLEPYTALYAKNITTTEQDQRLQHFVENDGDYVTWLKMVDYYGIQGTKRQTEETLISGVSVLHVAEMYLIAADALQTTNPTRALELFDLEIQSRGLTSLAQQGKTLTQDILFDEYRKEMFGEGQTWFNMKRLNRSITSNHEGRTIPGNASIYVVPIPEKEYEYR